MKLVFIASHVTKAALPDVVVEVLRSADESDLIHSVIVITGAYARDVENAVRKSSGDLKIKTINNPRHESVGTMLDIWLALDAIPKGADFFVCDTEALFTGEALHQMVAKSPRHCAIALTAGGHFTGLGMIRSEHREQFEGHLDRLLRKRSHTLSHRDLVCAMAPLKKCTMHKDHVYRFANKLHVKLGIVIKTFMRENPIQELVKSIAERIHVPYRLYIADDSGEIGVKKERLYKELESQGHCILRLPYDVGISAGRNAAIDALEDENFVMVMDDDLFITENTDITVPLKLLHLMPDKMICGGFTNSRYPCWNRLVIDKDHLLHVFHVPEPNEEWKEVESDINGPACRYLPVDEVTNFFVARRELFDTARWDPDLKLCEHGEFFIRLMKTQPDIVVASPDFTCDEPTYPKTPEYTKMRVRSGSVFQPIMYKKHGLLGRVIGHSERTLIDNVPESSIHRPTPYGAIEVPFRRTAKFFEAKLKKHGASSYAVDYGSDKSQITRFNVMADVWPFEGRETVLEVGCALGQFADFLQLRWPKIGYEGIDITPGMVKAAKQRRPDLKVRQANILDNDFGGKWDVVITGGIFYLLDDPEEWIPKLIVKMWKASRHALTFNTLSAWANKKDKGKYYADPFETYKLCREITPWVTLRHDYAEHDFSIYMYHKSEYERRG